MRESFLHHTIIVVIGLAFTGVFGVSWYFLRSGLFVKITRRGSERLLGTMMRYGFVLASLTVVLGFGLMYLNTREEKTRWIASQQVVAELRQMYPIDRDDAVNALASAVVWLAKGAASDKKIADALDALKQGRTDRAEAIFTDILADKKGKGKKADMEAAEAARYLGAIYYLHDTRKSIEAYREATILDPANPEGWNRYGSLLLDEGKYTEAEETFGRVLAIGKTTSNRMLEAVACGNLGIAFKGQGRLDKAEEAISMSLSINEQLGYKELLANGYSNLGDVYRLRGQWDKAEELFLKSLAVEKELGRKHGLAADYTNLSNVYRCQGKLDKAIDLLNKALAINQELGNKAGIAAAYSNLGSWHQEHGDINKAELMYSAALDVNKQLGRKEGIGLSYNNLGTVYAMQGDYDKAEEMFLQSLTIEEQLKHTEGLAKLHANLGLICEHRQQKEQARQHWLKSKSFYEQMDLKEQAEGMQRWIDELEV